MRDLGRGGFGQGALTAILNYEFLILNDGEIFDPVETSKIQGF